MILRVYYYFKTMQDSLAGSVEPWTKRREEQNSQDSQRYSRRFEEGYRAFQISSELNNAHLQIQKLNVQFQRERRQDRKMIEKVERERDQLASQCENLMAQLSKLTMMLEAQKQARKKVTASSKTLQVEVKSVRQALGTEVNSLEAVLAKLVDMKRKIAEGQQVIEGLSQNLLDIRSEKDKEIKSLKQESELAMKRADSAHKNIIIEYEGQLNSLRSKKNQSEVIEKQVKDLRIHLNEIEGELFEKERLLKNVVNQNAARQEQLKNLRIKQEIWRITQQKSREDKLTHDSQIQQLQIKLEICNRKIEQSEQKIEEQKTKLVHGQKLVHEQTISINRRQEEQIKMQEEIEELKKKVHHGEIYKQKCSKIQGKFREMEERATNYESIAHQYAQQIHDLQQSLEKIQMNSQQQQEEINFLREQQASRQKQIASLTHKINHQCEVIKQKNREIAIVMEKLQESKQKVAFLIYSQQGERFSPNIATEHFLEQMRLKISSHYQQLLRDQEQIRKGLQAEVNDSRKKLFDLKGLYSRCQQQLAQLRQDKQLAEQENEKMNSLHSQRQQLHEKKIVQMRDRYRQMSRVRSQKNFRGVGMMRIITCFSYSLINHAKQKNEYVSNFQKAYENMDSTVRRINSPSRLQCYNQSKY